jgi:electron transport complex protein RnfB
MEFETTAEKQLCPTNALIRKFIEHPYYEYTIDKERCTGCSKCVKGCQTFGNGSLYLQVDHARCVNCNQCAIAKACPANAFVRLPSDKPYLFKGLQTGEAPKKVT